MGHRGLGEDYGMGRVMDTLKECLEKLIKLSETMECTAKKLDEAKKAVVRAECQVDMRGKCKEEKQNG
jgi:hypothetical protein